MTASSSKPSTARLVGKLAVPVVFASVISVAAVWQDRLDEGSALFVAMIFSLSVIRTLATRGGSLPIASAVAVTREKCLVTLVAAGMAWLPIITIATPLLDFAAYRPPIAALAVGVLVGCTGLWLFFRSHADLGVQWSPVLELRERHQLITEGIYKRIRHPMYSALFLITAAQLLLLGNWISGPAGLIAFLILYVVRVGPEEEMMEETFGDAYRKYRRRTGRLLPKSSA